MGMFDPDDADFVYATPKRERWITQTTFFDPSDPKNPNKGNCTEAAVASILNLPLAAVPTFHVVGGESSQFWRNFKEFLWERGFYVQMMPGNHCPNSLYLASGPSERGCNHMVVMCDDFLVHDPHPSRAGLTHVENVWFLLPIDPGSVDITKIDTMSPVYG